MELTTDFNISTSGDSGYTQIVRPVPVTSIEMRDPEMDGTYAEVRVHLADWRTQDHGFIFPDQGFLNQLRDRLKEQGFSEDSVQNLVWAELGLQGPTWATFVGGRIFIQRWLDTVTE